MLCRNIFISPKSSPVANHQNPPKIDLRTYPDFYTISAKIGRKRCSYMKNFSYHHHVTQREWEDGGDRQLSVRRDQKRRLGSFTFATSAAVPQFCSQTLHEACLVIVKCCDSSSVLFRSEDIRMLCQHFGESVKGTYFDGCFSGFDNILWYRAIFFSFLNNFSSFLSKRKFPIPDHLQK